MYKKEVVFKLKSAKLRLERKQCFMSQRSGLCHVVVYEINWSLHRAEIDRKRKEARERRDSTVAFH